MHFSIPDTQEFTDGAGNAYIVIIYKIFCLLYIVYFTICTILGIFSIGLQYSYQWIISLYGEI